MISVNFNVAVVTVHINGSKSKFFVLIKTVENFDVQIHSTDQQQTVLTVANSERTVGIDGKFKVKRSSILGFPLLRTVHLSRHKRAGHRMKQGQENQLMLHYPSRI